MKHSLLLEILGLSKSSDLNDNPKATQYIANRFINSLKDQSMEQSLHDSGMTEDQIKQG